MLRVSLQQLPLLSFGVRLKGSSERLEMSRFVVKNRYFVFDLVYFQVCLMFLLHISSVPGHVQEVAVEEHPSLHMHRELMCTKGRIRDCCTPQHSKQLQFRGF